MKPLHQVQNFVTVCGLCLSLVVLPGCWDYQRINYRAQVIGIGIDPLPGSANQLRFTFQVPNFGGGGTSGIGDQKSSASSSTQNYRNFTATGESLNEALSKAQIESDRSFYMGNVETVVMNEHLTQEQVRGVVTELMRSTQVSSIASLVATPDSANTILESKGDLAPADVISRYDETVDQVAYKTRRKTWMFLRDLNAIGVEPALGVVHRKAEQLKVEGTMVYKQTEPKEELGMQDTLSYNLVMGKAKRFYMLIHDGNRSFTTYVMGARSKRRVTFSSTGVPLLEVNVHLWGVVVQDESRGVKALTKAEMERYESVMERQVQNQIQSMMSHLQTDHADIVGFGRQLLYTQPSLEHKIASDWGDLFSRARVNFKVDVSLSQKGRLM